MIQKTEPPIPFLFKVYFSKLLFIPGEPTFFSHILNLLCIKTLMYYFAAIHHGILYLTGFDHILHLIVI
jgi:hypothetical protein